MIDAGIRGMTSNPSIFEKAIAGGTAYDDRIRQLGGQGKSTGDIASALFMDDIRDACDLLRGVFDSSGGEDGFVSIEVNPKLAAQTDATIHEAHALWEAIDRPNLMIKIPATPEGLPAIGCCLADGINVNITLMFSLEQYRDVATAYIDALEMRVDRGLPVDRSASVASVFVSRIDTMIDDLLEKIGTAAARELRGKGALANSRLVYQEFLRIFSGDRWNALAARGAHVQRPLWASTSTKNPEYSRLLYVEPLIGPHTVNTVPPDTLEAILADGPFDRMTIADGVADSRRTMDDLAAVGVDVDQVMDRLLREGVEKFEASFDGLFGKIEAKRMAFVA